MGRCRPAEPLPARAARGRPPAEPPIKLRWDRILWLLAILAMTVVAARTATTAPSTAEAMQPPTSVGRPPPTATATPAPADPAAPGPAATAGLPPGGCPVAHAAVVRSAPGSERTVALTFDDGPGEWTDDVLRVLDEYQVPAAFFVVGRAAQEYPHLVRDIADSGHLVANHTWNHEPPPPGDSWPASYVDGEVAPTGALLRELTGADACWYRPPLGVMHGTAYEAATRPLDIAHWSVDTRDWKVQSGASADPDGSLAAAVAAAATAGIGQPNPLVLLHDGGGWRGATVAALPKIIEAYRDAGYRFVRLDDPLPTPHRLADDVPPDRRHYGPVGRRITP